MKSVFTTLFLILLSASILMNDTFSQSFYTGKVGVNLSIYGRVRIFSDSLTTRQIDRSSLLVASAPDAVFDYKKDAEAIDTSMTVLNPLLSDFELYGSIDNSYDSLFAPPNVLAKINVYGWNNVGGVVVKFTILNREPGSINGIVGMEIIPQPDGSYGLETIEYISSAQVVSLYRLPSSKITGYKILSAPVTTVNTIDWYEDYSLIDDSLYNWMTTGTLEPLFDAGGDGPVTFFSQNAVPINSGDSAVVFVGISVGADQTEMLANMDDVVTKYNQLTSVESDFNNIPSDFVLEQNYPNPFNPSTKISFGLPQRSNIVLKVFNTLGEEVAELVNESLEAGTHSYNFDASNLTSGIYIYSLQTEAGVISKKMTLVK